MIICLLLLALDRIVAYIIIPIIDLFADLIYCLVADIIHLPNYLREVFKDDLPWLRILNDFMNHRFTHFLVWLSIAAIYVIIKYDIRL